MHFIRFIDKNWVFMQNSAFFTLFRIKNEQFFSLRAQRVDHLTGDTRRPESTHASIFRGPNPGFSTDVRPNRPETRLQSLHASWKWVCPYWFQLLSPFLSTRWPETCSKTGQTGGSKKWKNTKKITIFKKYKKSKKSKNKKKTKKNKKKKKNKKTKKTKKN